MSALENNVMVFVFVIGVGMVVALSIVCKDKKLGEAFRSKVVLLLESCGLKHTEVKSPPRYFKLDNR